MGNCIPGALCFVRLGLGVVCRSAGGDGCCSLSDGRGWAGEGSVHRSDLRLYFVTNTGFCNVTINGDAWKRGDIFRVGPLHRALPVCVAGCSCDITLALARGGGSGGGAGRQLGTTRRCWVTPSCSPARMGLVLQTNHRLPSQSVSTIMERPLLGPSPGWKCLLY